MHITNKINRENLKNMGEKKKNLTLYIYIHTQQISSFFFFFFLILIGWQLNSFHSCLIEKKESHRLEESLNYYQIEFDEIVNGKLKSEEMLRERVKNGNRFGLME